MPCFDDLAPAESRLVVSRVAPWCYVYEMDIAGSDLRGLALRIRDLGPWGPISVQFVKRLPDEDTDDGA
jgi:hypothetical protein